MKKTAKSIVAKHSEADSPWIAPGDFNLLPKKTYAGSC